MKIADVVNQLAKVIPQISDFFSESVPITAISGDGALISVQTGAPHGLATGEFFTVRNVKVENSVVSAIFTTENGQSFLEIVTALDHDLTLNKRETEAKFAELIGFTDAAWNANLQLVAVSNRKTFKVVNGVAGAPVLNGNELLLEAILGTFNGPSLATVVDTTNFTYPSATTDVIVGQGGQVETNTRIAGVVNFDRALDQYEALAQDKYFMWVLAPQSVTANKSRGSETDINDEQTQQTSLNQNIRDGFIIVVIANATDEPGALRSMDNIRETVFREILVAVRGVAFPSGLACEPNQISNFISHGTLLYTKALYIHQFIFEQPLVMSARDSVQAESRAFRDIDFVNSTDGNADAPDLTASINLDDDPL